LNQSVANSFFQFKQFRVEQAACAMKVCTDACVLGALAPIAGARRILDIGTGTGLLALMAAQRTPLAHLEAVELEEAAAAQAAANFAASPWAGRLRLHPVPLGAFAATQPALFDHILCNPPFFRNALRSPNPQRTTARHTSEDTLTFTELAGFAVRFLTFKGQLTVLLPPPEMQQFEQEAAVAGLYPVHRRVLRHRPGSKPLRHITTFGRQPTPVQQQDLALHEADSADYSGWFREALGPFYLAL
jgi:tRNA1Val (adenine37-N6)-methyltransferase